MASLPYWPINPSLNATDPASRTFKVQLDIVRALWVMLPGAILWGASFPLALASVAKRGQDSARLVGGVYAANTVGAIVGSMLTGLVLISYFGSKVAQQVLIGVAALSGLLLLGAEGTVMASVTVLVVALGAGLLARSVPQIPGMFIAYGRYMATWIGSGNEVVYQGEGVTASVAVTRTPNGVLNYHNAGKVQASSEPQDMRLQRMLGHITTLVPDNPARVLVIGCGAGVTAGAASIDPLVIKADDCRNRTARAEGGIEALRRTQLPRRGQSEGRGAARRCTALSADDGREVRRRHVRPAGPVGEGGSDALHS
jgi:spermidine synthase